MKTRLNALLVTAGITAVFLTGCVSSKKYKSSQAALQQVRNDSTRLAQQVASLNENVQALEQKNTTLQRSLDSTSSNYAAQQKNLDYYQTYFTQQQGTMTQVSDEIKSALSQAGLANEDVQQVNNTIYVRLDENSVFKKNSTAVTTSGKQALTSLAQVIKNRSDNINVFVSNADSSSGQSTATGNMSSDRSTTMNDNTTGNATGADMSANTTTTRHRTTHHMRTRRSTTKTAAQNDAAASANSNVAANTSTPDKPKATVHKKVHHKYTSSEGSMTFYSNNGKSSKSKAWALQQGRMNTVANNFLQNGVQKVNVSLQQPVSGGSQNNDIKVIITPAMKDFNPQKSSTANTDTK